MRRVVGFSRSIAAVVAGCWMAGGAAAEAPRGALVMREHRVTDPGMNDTVASTLLVPKGWSVEGGLNRPAPQLYSNPVLVDLTIEAPDGRAARFYPSMTFEFNANQQAPPFTPTQNGNFWHPLPESVGAWLMGMARQHPDPEVSGLEFVEEADVPELTAKLREQAAATYRQVAQLNQTGAAVGVGQQFDTQATRVVLRYTKGGKRLEETILVTWQVMLTGVQGRVQSGLWSIGMMRSMRGPVGSDYMNDPALAAIFSSVRPNPAWVGEMQRYWAELARIRHRGNQERRQQAWAAHQKRMQTLNETSDIIANGWRSRNASSDRMQRMQVDAIHEQTPYATPSGETVRLPSFYDHVYTDGKGTYILNNDAFYNPNRDSSVNNVDWQRIEPTRP